MLPVGLDAHERTSSLCILDDAGQVVQEKTLEGHPGRVIGHPSGLEEPLRVWEGAADAAMDAVVDAAGFTIDEDTSGQSHAYLHSRRPGGGQVLYLRTRIPVTAGAKGVDVLVLLVLT